MWCREVIEMLTYKGGNQTKGGFYLKKGEWEMVTVDGKNYTVRERLRRGDSGLTNLFLGPA